MPKFNNYDQTEAKFESGFNQPKPGAYVLRIMAVRTEWDEYNFQTGLRDHCTTANEAAVMFVYDIVGGDFDGEYSRDFYMDDNGALDPKKDFLHQYKFYWGDLNNPKDAAKAKYVLDCLTASNQGFQAKPAFEADAWQLFINQQFGAILNGTVKTNDQGYDNWNLKPQRKIFTVQEIVNGKTLNAKGEMVDLPEPKINDKRTNVDDDGGSSTAAAADQVPVDTYEDVPFSV
jgi:hypothetical protein